MTEARRRNHHVTGGSLRKGLVYGSDDGHCRHEIVPTPNEESVYAALGLPWVEPSERRAP